MGISLQNVPVLPGTAVELTCPLPEEFVRMLEKLRRNT